VFSPSPLSLRPPNAFHPVYYVVLCGRARVVRCLVLALWDGVGELLLGSIVLIRYYIPILLINASDMIHMLHIK